MKQLKIKDIKILLDVIETQSFSASAKNAGLTQASISKSIAAVEAVFDIKVINRDSRPVTITAFGETILSPLRRYVQETSELYELVENYKKTPSGEVNIYSPSGMQAYLADSILPKLCQRFPELSVSVITSNNPNEEYFKDANVSNACDILISYSAPQNHNLVAKVVKRIQMNVFSTANFYRQHPFSTLEELARHPFILLNSMSQNSYEATLPFVHSKTLGEKAITVKGRLKFDNIYTAIHCCRKEMGYMVTSPILLKNIDDIIPVLPSEWGVYIDCYVIYRSRKNLPYRVQLSLDYIVELMSVTGEN